MADEAPTPPGDAGQPGGSPSGGMTPNDIAQEALRAAQDAIASLQGMQDDVNAAAQPAPMAASVAAAAQASSQPAPQPMMAPAAPPPGAKPFALPAFQGNLSPEARRSIDLLGDVNLNVKIELGRTRMLVEDVLRLGEGTVVELDKLAGDPVDIYVNERHVARGEVLVLNDNFCVRVNEIIKPLAEDERKAS